MAIKQMNALAESGYFVSPELSPILSKLGELIKPVGKSGPETFLGIRDQYGPGLSMSEGFHGWC